LEAKGCKLPLVQIRIEVPTGAVFLKCIDLSILIFV